jgi:NitT/TauT family transport system substrate-binding protein
MRTWRLLGIVIGSVLLAGCGSGSAAPSAAPASASAQASSLGTLKVGASAINSSLLPIQLAADYGLYKQYGATVEFNPTGDGKTTIAAMESGEIAAAYVNPSNVAEAVAAGSGSRSVMSVGARSSYLMVVTPDITKVEDLKGKSFAIANPGGLASTVAELFLGQYGLKNGTNITLLDLGTEPTRIQAMQSGQVQGTIINPSFRGKITSPLKVLLDLRDLDLGIPGGAVGISGKVLKNQAASDALVKGTWDGIKFVTDPANKDKVVAGLVKYLKLDPGAQAEDAYGEMQKDMQGALPPKLDIPGVGKTLSVLAVSNPSIKNVKPEDVVDNSILDRVIAQGFK